MLVSMNAQLTVTLEVSIELCVMTYSKVPLWWAAEMNLQCLTRHSQKDLFGLGCSVRKSIKGRCVQEVELLLAGPPAPHRKPARLHQHGGNLPEMDLQEMGCQAKGWVRRNGKRINPQTDWASGISEDVPFYQWCKRSGILWLTWQNGYYISPLNL